MGGRKIFSQKVDKLQVDIKTRITRLTGPHHFDQHAFISTSITDFILHFE